MKRQIIGFTINKFMRKRKSDSPATAFVVELSDGATTHRTCLSGEMLVIADEVTDYPHWDDGFKTDAADFLFTSELNQRDRSKKGTK